MISSRLKGVVQGGRGKIVSDFLCKITEGSVLSNALKFFGLSVICIFEFPHPEQGVTNVHRQLVQEPRPTIHSLLPATILGQHQNLCWAAVKWQQCKKKMFCIFPDVPGQLQYNRKARSLPCNPAR